MSRAASLVGIIVTVALSTYCLAFFSAYQTIQASELYISQLEDRGWIEDASRWNRQVEQLEKASLRNPLDADILILLVRLYQWRAYEQRLWPQVANRTLSQSLRFARLACRRRPSWGLAWATLAVVKNTARQRDKEMIFGINKAIELGPWERQVQHQIVIAGIPSWPWLPAKSRRLLMDVIKVTLKDPKLFNVVIEIAINNEWEEHLRPLIEDNERLLWLLKNQIRKERKVL